MRPGWPAFHAFRPRRHRHRARPGTGDRPGAGAADGGRHAAVGRDRAGDRTGRQHGTEAAPVMKIYPLLTMVNQAAAKRGRMLRGISRLAVFAALITTAQAQAPAYQIISNDPSGAEIRF